LQVQSREFGSRLHASLGNIYETQRLYAPRISELPAATRQLLLRLALDGTGDPAVLTATCGASELEDLLPAERAELVDFDDATRRFTFRHPLVGSTVVELSESSERRAAHRMLAEALTGQPERAAWHLAEATATCDEHVAALLEQAALHAQRRGDAVGAVAALLRSADLSPAGPGRSRRLAQAACIGADVTGQLSGVPRLLADARNVGPQPGGSLQAAVATALLLINEQGDLDTAHARPRWSGGRGGSRTCWTRVRVLRLSFARWWRRSRPGCLLMRCPQVIIRWRPGGM
jgi:hypothetical protein